jgi:hypothetical protein
MSPFCVGYQGQAPITPALTGRAAIPEGVVRRVVVDVLKKERPGEAEARARVDLATQ